MDIKELRIGNHVLYEGKRVKIDHISQFGDIGLVDITYTLVSPKDLDPIPLTEELLKELGFECLWGVPKDMEKHIGEIGLYSTHLNNGKYRISISNDDSTNYGDMLCQYLHELENFVYLTTKQELI